MKSDIKQYACSIQAWRDGYTRHTLAFVEAVDDDAAYGKAIKIGNKLYPSFAIGAIIQDLTTIQFATPETAFIKSTVY